MFFRVADEVPHDHEIAGKLHLLDDLYFPREPLLVVADLVLQPTLRLQLAQHFHPPREAFAANTFEVAVDIHSRRHIESRKRIAHLVQLEIAPLSDRQRPLQDVGLAAEDLLHFLVALHEELVGLELHAILFGDRLARLDADHHVLRVGVVLTEVMAVVSRNRGNAELTRNPELIAENLVLLR